MWLGRAEGTALAEDPVGAHFLQTAQLLQAETERPFLVAEPELDFGITAHQAAASCQATAPSDTSVIVHCIRLPRAPFTSNEVQWKLPCQ